MSKKKIQLPMIAVALFAGASCVATSGSGSGSGPSRTSTPTIPADAIVFESSRALNGGDTKNINATSNIWVMNADGSGQTPLTKLTQPGTTSLGPKWSPNSKKIAFTSGRALNGSDAANSTSNIWVMNADGSGQTPLTKLIQQSTSSSSPEWSPDGSKIAFQSDRALNGSDAPNTTTDVPPTSNIWVMNADGSGQAPLTKLTAFTANSNGPVWSRDGTKILFTSDRALDGSNAANSTPLPTQPTTSNIWVINADGSGAAALTKLTQASSISPTQR
jgi:Tol biopolymer transport system component